MAVQVAGPATQHDGSVRARGPRLRWVLGQVLVVAIGIFAYFRIRGLTHASVGVALDHSAENMSTNTFTPVSSTTLSSSRGASSTSIAY